MIGAIFTQLLVQKVTSFTGKFEATLDTQIDKLKLLAFEQDVIKSKKTCEEIVTILPRLNLPLETFNKILKTVKNLINSIKKILDLLKNLIGTIGKIPIRPLTPLIPIPTTPIAIPPLSTIYPSVGNITNLMDVKNFANEKFKYLEYMLDSLNSFIELVNNRIKNLVGKVKELSTNVNSCQIKHYSTTEDINKTNLLLDNLVVGLSQEIPENIKNETEGSYRGFTFEIIEVPKTYTSQNVNRRYAIARNSNGIETLRGDVSFATNKQILINELKFIIDTQNLVG